jgi:bis(5'-nucleosyl)-tetraphosphatase (symmetrical)
MATYAIGDIQGCYQSFVKLLKKISFNPSLDQLWLAGDMINRGPDSLKVMAFILENQDSISCVLGNHDLHFLAVSNECKKISPKDTFCDILGSKLRDEITSYLSQQALVVRNKKKKWLMVHAGIYPTWSAKKAITLSKEVSKVLQSSNADQFYKNMYGNQPSIWDDDLISFERLRLITNVMTRMRFLDQYLSLDLTVKSSIEKKPEHLNPWFDIYNRKLKYSLIFGHWAALEGKCKKENFYAVDTGCVWGGKLTALRLDDKELFQV